MLWKIGRKCCLLENRQKVMWPLMEANVCWVLIAIGTNLLCRRVWRDKLDMMFRRYAMKCHKKINVVILDELSNLKTSVFCLTTCATICVNVFSVRVWYILYQLEVILIKSEPPNPKKLVNNHEKLFSKLVNKYQREW